MSAPRPRPRLDLRRRAVVAAPMLWLGLFFLAPFLIVLKISLSHGAQAVPPYAPHWPGVARLGEFLSQLSLENYQLLVSDSLYVGAYLSSLRLALISTALCLLIGFPLAYAVARAPSRWRPLLLVAIVLPFWTSFLIRVYAWMAILRPDGVLDAVLMGLGLTRAPLNLLNSETAVLIGMVYSYLPFMALPLYASLERIDRSLIEAAQDLGATPARAFFTVTAPLARPGVLAGVFLVLIPSIGEFVIPDLLGGSDTLMVGKVLWTEFFSNRDWPLASAVAVVMLILLVGPIVVFQRLAERADGEAAR
jgi:putrescine transport system permease protein